MPYAFNYDPHAGHEERAAEWPRFAHEGWLAARDHALVANTVTTGERARCRGRTCWWRPMTWRPPRRFRATLTAEGYEVHTVGHGADVLERFSQQHYDLLISSIQLPDRDGRDLYIALRARWPFAYPRVLFLVPVNAQIPPPARGLVGPEAPILRTPLTPEALRDVARRALGVL